MSGQNFNAHSFFEQGKSCPNCDSTKWVREGDVVGEVGKICPICQGTGMQKVPMPNVYDETKQGPYPPMNQSLLNINVDGKLDSSEILDEPWDRTPDYIIP